MFLAVTKCFRMWWPGTESNRRRQPFQGCALPAEPLSRFRISKKTATHKPNLWPAPVRPEEPPLARFPPSFRPRPETDHLHALFIFTLTTNPLTSLFAPIRPYSLRGRVIVRAVAELHLPKLALIVQKKFFGINQGGRSIRRQPGHSARTISSAARFARMYPLRRFSVGALWWCR